VNFEIIPYSKKHFTSITLLIDVNFGMGYSLSKNINVENNFAWCAVNETKKIIGFSLLKVEGKTGFFELTVVDELYRRKGVGTSLFNERIKKSQLLGLKKIILNHWLKNNSQEPSYALKLGFSLSAVKNNYWSTQSLIFGYNCIECEKLPCVCKCHVYEMTLGGDC
tara:strand:+ start:360 stop:857 length:498 start_codon:yes stop_codon:yes gene_type:complete